VPEWTGRSMQRRMWRFKFDATPNRRPHVLQTKAGRMTVMLYKDSRERGTDNRTFFASMDEQMLKKKKRSIREGFECDQLYVPSAMYLADQSFCGTSNMHAFSPEFA
jgi:hypothetical protein